jgi:hypothetical protein
MLRAGVTNTAGVGKNAIVEAKTITTLFKKTGMDGGVAMALQGNRKIHQMDHEALKQKRYSVDLFPNSGAARKVLPCQMGYNSYRVLRVPPVSSTNSMQVPTGFARGQRVGLATSGPVLKKLPRPIIENYRT